MSLSFTCLSPSKLLHVFFASRPSEGMLQFAENEEISTANLRFSRRGDEQDAIWRASCEASADWRHARSNRLACSPTGRLHSVLHRLAWFAQCLAFCTFCPRRAPVVPRLRAGMLADKSLEPLRLPLASGSSRLRGCSAVDFYQPLKRTSRMVFLRGHPAVDVFLRCISEVSVYAGR